MNGVLHNLCGACSRITFTLHISDACESLGCKYERFNQTYKPVTKRRFTGKDDIQTHSETFLHSPTLEDFEFSARAGCHLCTIMLFALDHSHTQVPIDEACPDGVALRLIRMVRPYGNPAVEVATPRCIPEEELLVMCGPRCSAVSVTPPSDPELDCSELYVGSFWSFVTSPSQYMWFGELHTKYYARCVQGRAPSILRPDGGDPERLIEVIDGFPRLIMYLTGQVYNCCLTFMLRVLIALNPVNQCLRGEKRSPIGRFCVRRPLTWNAPAQPPALWMGA